MPRLKPAPSPEGPGMSQGETMLQDLETHVANLRHQMATLAMMYHSTKRDYEKALLALSIARSHHEGTATSEDQPGIPQADEQVLP